MEVRVEKPDQNTLAQLNVSAWPIWEKQESTFEWSYPQQEICYLLEGRAEVTLPSGEKVAFGEGDLVTFPQGLDCTWHIIQKVRKHYQLG
ncbi:MAG: DUF861 domain-containing protein [Candidatus Omnitrophica bacterium]|nr:DUF861 domain-containing protein [Candidatus Omnitrophota bacterium]